LPLDPIQSVSGPAPIRARVVRDDHQTVCRIVLGKAEDFTGPTASEVPIPDSKDFLQVQADDDLNISNWKWPAALITFTAALLTGLVGLLLLMRRELATARPASGAGMKANVPLPEVGGYGGPTGGPTGPPQVPHQKTPGAAAARPVDLAALTTSGVSGLTVDRGISGDFDVYAASQVGLSHANKGGTREDAYAVGGAPDSGWVFLAVADGLGSAQDSHAAAQVACRTALQTLHSRLARVEVRIPYDHWAAIANDVVGSVVAALQPGAVVEWADRLGYVPADGGDGGKNSAPATTLVFAAVGPVYQGEYMVLWGSVGDSDALTVSLDSGQVNWLTNTATKQAGGLVSNATSALPRDAAALIIGGVSVPANTMTVLATDGMADAIRQETGQFSRLLPQIAGSSPSEWAFGELVGFDLPGLADDRTIAAAWPRTAPRGRGRR
jgi:hypothetical protein